VLDLNTSRTSQRQQAEINQANLDASFARRRADEEAQMRYEEERARMYDLKTRML
jgi:hypothetical protein